MTPATGELRKLGIGWEARIRVGGKRVPFKLTTIATNDEAAARARCNAMADVAVRLRRAGEESETEKLLEMAARARVGRPWDAVLAAVDKLCTSGGTAPLRAASSFEILVDKNERPAKQHYRLRRPRQHHPSGAGQFRPSSLREGDAT